MSSGRWTQKGIRKSIERVLEYMKDYGYYEPFLERFPLRVDEEMAESQRKEILDHKTVAMASDDTVYFLSEGMVNVLERALDTVENPYSYKTDEESNITTILCHEYSHILCQHHEIGLRIYDSYQGKVPSEVWWAHTYACEVEANRGMLIDQTSLVFQNGINDYTYPEVAKLPFYENLFEYFLKMNKTQKQAIKKLLQNALEQLAADAEASGNADAAKAMRAVAHGKSIKGGGKGKGHDKNGKKGLGQEPGQEDKEAEGGSAKESQDDGPSDGRDGDADGTDDGDWDELSDEMIDQAINSTREVIKEMETGSCGERGYGLENSSTPYKASLKPHERLEREYIKWDEKRVKKELGKLKGLIRGEISKNRESTYARPSRRPITSGSNLIRKGVRYEKSYQPKVLIALDSSGSMCSTTMTEVACAIENIFKDLGKPKYGSYICKHDDRVSDILPMKDWKVVVESYCPDGGNDFSDVVKAANKLGVDVVLNVGDGQDCCNRSSSGLTRECKAFVGANRKWYDVLVTSKGDNYYYQREAHYDEQNGFKREGIYLGNKISKYLR